MVSALEIIFVPVLVCGPQLAGLVLMFVGPLEALVLVLDSVEVDVREEAYANEGESTMARKRLAMAMTRRRPTIIDISTSRLYTQLYFQVSTQRTYLNFLTSCFPRDVISKPTCLPTALLGGPVEDSHRWRALIPER